MNAVRILLILVITAALGCLEKTTEQAPLSSTLSCSSEIMYAWDPVYGESKKYTYEINPITQTCVKKNLVLTNYEQGLDRRRRNNITCKPQSIGKVWLKAAGNFYSYRNDRVFLELDGSTGQFRRITTGVTSDIHSSGAGLPSFSRDLGCFYLREDHETEPINPQDFGKQILLDMGPIGASSEGTTPIEVFKYEVTGNDWRMVRFDQNEDIGGYFCPYLLTPWEFCTALRNGNSHFLPDLDSSTNVSLTSEAILIRSEFNFTSITATDFNNVWDNAVKNSVETYEQAFKYSPKTIVDVPNYVWEAWRDYVMGNRPYMPDTQNISITEICYPSVKQITYVDGSTGLISGQACYDSAGNYTFQ